MRLSQEHPKGRCANYERYELAWSSYPRASETSIWNGQLINKNNQDNYEPSRAKSKPKNESNWSEGEETADADEDKATVRKQTKKLLELADELIKCQGERVSCRGS